MFTLLSMLHSEPHRTLRDICYVNDTKHLSAKHPHNVKATERNINNGFVVQGAGIRDDFFFPAYPDFSNFSVHHTYYSFWKKMADCIHSCDCVSSGNLMGLE